jgi:hypothetical protein
MKTYLLLLCFLLFAYALQAQPNTAQPEKIVVNTTDLTPDQLTKIKAQKATEDLQLKLANYGKWVGVGGEIGTAIREGLTAVVDVTGKFGDTNVGKFTMIMIAWKIMGSDIVRIIFGIILLLVGIPIALRIMKTFMPYRKILKTDPGLFKYPKEYEIVKPDYQNDGSGVIWTFVVFAIYCGVVALIMFA